MVKYLLDTDQVIELVRENPVVEAGIEKIGLDFCAISEITLAEMSVLAAKTRIDKYWKQISFLEEHFTIIPFKAHREYGAIRAMLEKRGTRLDDMDILIAATALAENCTLITGNKKHFSRIPGLNSDSF